MVCYELIAEIKGANQKASNAMCEVENLELNLNNLFYLNFFLRNWPPYLKRFLRRVE